MINITLPWLFYFRSTVCLKCLPYCITFYAYWVFGGYFFFNNCMLGLDQCGNQFSLVPIRKFFHNRIYLDCKVEYIIIKA